ncbi:single-stranded-DNA-specific exonuclease RecJ [bacterium]|nr:single-stranded-DNA-specific exonuclease RecJ [bacterium]
MKWVLAEREESSLSIDIARELGIPPVISQILVNRGLKTPEELKSFFYPSLSDLADPFLIPDMDKAVERLLKALRNRERIVIFGDYDVDGITSTALLYYVLNRFGADVIWYLPDRLLEGYGLSEKGIDEALSKGATLLVSVDCGITGIDSVEYARSKGMDCIITDHHEPGDRIPDAVAIVDPKLSKEDTPFRELAGVGVAYKLADALYEALGEDKTFLHKHLDLVGLGTIADIVPLTKENRILARFGLRTLESTSKPGIKALLQIAGLLGNELSSWHVVFVLAPRLNAVGRIGNPSLAFNLLTSNSHGEALEMAKKLEEENKLRKKLDERIFAEALELAEQTVKPTDRAIVLSSDSWHLGVIGIVASRLVERYYRPVVMISTIDGIGKGSARSIPGFHLLDAIRHTSHLLSKFGGHKYAAGLCIEPDNIEEFKEEFQKYASGHIEDDDLIPRLTINAKILPEEIDLNLIKWLELFNPFGPENMRPIFLIENAEIIGQPRIVGANHLRFKIRNSARAIDTIGFGFGEYKNSITMHTRPVNLAVVIEKNTYFGDPDVQLRVKDIKLGNWQLMME